MAAGRDGELAVVLRPSAEVDAAALRALFAASETPAPAFDLRRSVCWVTAHVGEQLVGFVNVVGDGGRHTFLLDTLVHPEHRRRGIGLALVRCAAEEARALGAQWLHVDHEPRHAGFYRRCGFRPTEAGLLALSAAASGAAPAPAGLALRRYAAEDGPACAAVLGSLSDWFTPAASAAYLAELPRLPTWVATLEGEVVGFVAVVRPQPRALEVHVLAVGRAVQGRGIGRALLGLAERFARAQDARLMLVKTLGPSRADAFYEQTRSFYTALGYEPLLESDRLWDGAPALLLVKPL